MLMISLFGLSTSLLAQDKPKVYSLSRVVWFGVDFTSARFLYVTENPVEIVNQYLNAINAVIISEPEKYNINEFFNKVDVIYSLETITENNSKIDPSKLVINGDYIFDPAEVKEIINKLDTKDHTGTGLLFIAESLNKSTQAGTYHVCFFDIATKEIIDSERITGTAKGFGFRNYWAGSIYNVMKKWANE